jgi:hypothetical protein
LNPLSSTTKSVEIGVVSSAAEWPDIPATYGGGSRSAEALSTVSAAHCRGMQLKVSGRKLPFPELLYRKTLAR